MTVDWIKIFWLEIEKWIYDKTTVLINFTKTEILLGKGGKGYNIENLIVLVYKFYVYKQRCRNETLHLNGVKLDLYNQYRAEKYICSINGKQNIFEKKWSKFLNIFQEFKN